MVVVVVSQRDERVCDNKRWIRWDRRLVLWLLTERKHGKMMQSGICDFGIDESVGYVCIQGGMAC